MVMETKGVISDEGVQELRHRVGRYYEPRRGTTTATVDNIAHFCQAACDPNPIYLDEEYAGRGPYGGIIAPPMFLYGVIQPTGNRVGGLRGVHAFHGGNDWEWYDVVHTGDVIAGSYRPTAIVEKTSAMGGKSVVVYTETVYSNQHGDVVAHATGWTIRIERRGAQDRGKHRDLKQKVWSEQEREDLLNAYQREREGIRGSEPRYWESVQVGDELPQTIKGPLTTSEMVAWDGVAAAGTAAHEARLARLLRHPAFSYRDPVTGGREAIARVHERPDAAAAAGVPAPYDIGAQRTAWFATVLTNWMGDAGRLVTLSIEYRRFNLFGDLQCGGGRVLSKRVEGRRHLVDLEVWLKNQDGQVTTPGQATIELPSSAERGANR
jgi:acyl dehydratase